jgi:hypothetical protein
VPTPRSRRTCVRKILGTDGRILEGQNIESAGLGRSLPSADMSRLAVLFPFPDDLH